MQRLQAACYEIKPGKYVSCRAPGQERFTRLKTLGADYTEEAIRERIAGRRTRTAKAPKAERRGVNLLIDIENSIKAQQSQGYEQWAKIHNLKQAATALKAAQIGGKLPSIPALQAEYEKLQAQIRIHICKKATYCIKRRGAETYNSSHAPLITFPK